MARSFPGIPDAVIEAARREYQASTFTSAPELRPITCDGRVVGFYCPRERKVGRSLGPVFVMPEFRRRGLALRLFGSIEGPLVACVRDDNPASQRLVERAGFVRWKRYAAGWWWRRP